MKTLPDFLSDEPSSAPADAPAPEAPVDLAPAAEPTPEAAPAAEGQPRGPDGKFAPATPAAEAAPAAQAPAEPPPSAPEAPAPVLTPAPTPEPNFAPLSALLDERDKRQAAEKRARDLEEWRAQQEAKISAQPAPDPTEDPEAYRAHQEQQRQSELWNMRLEMSRGFAAMRHGEETAGKAFQWGVDRCDTDPFFNAKVRASPDPVGFVVAEWQREQQLSQMTPERLAAFQAWEAAQAQPAVQPAPVAAAAPTPIAAPAAPPASPAPPRPSLAGAPSAASASAPLPRDGEATFARMFEK